MKLTIAAVFDGTVFRPRQPVELPPGTECTLTIETDAGLKEPGDDRGFDAFTAIAAMAVETGIRDLAARSSQD